MKRSPQTRTGRRPRAGDSHAWGAPGVGNRLSLWATRLAIERASAVVLGDGAEWIWNLAERHFREPVQILDFYDAAEYF